MPCYDILACCILQRGVDFCRGENVTGVTTHEQMNYTASPVLFHLGRDPGEKYPIRYVHWTVLWSVRAINTQWLLPTWGLYVDSTVLSSSSIWIEWSTTMSAFCAPFLSPTYRQLYCFPPLAQAAWEAITRRRLKRSVTRVLVLACILALAHRSNSLPLITQRSAAETIPLTHYLYQPTC